MFYNNKLHIRRRVLFEKSGLSKEEDFLDMVDGIEIKIDKNQYPDSVFFFKGDKYYFEQDSKNGYFWCSYDNVWSFFERQYGMNIFEIQVFIKYVVERHFKMKVSTPRVFYNDYSNEVERHFKMKVSTPTPSGEVILLLVERHFKMKVSTPNFPKAKRNFWWKDISK